MKTALLTFIAALTVATVATSQVFDTAGAGGSEPAHRWGVPGGFDGTRLLDVGTRAAHMRRVGSPIYTNGILSGDYYNYYVADIGQNIATVRYATVTMWWAVDGQLSNNAGAFSTRTYPLLTQWTNNIVIDGTVAMVSTYPYSASNMNIYLGRGLNGSEFMITFYDQTSVWTRVWNCLVMEFRNTAHPTTLGGSTFFRLNSPRNIASNLTATIGSSGYNPELRLFSTQDANATATSPRMLLSDVRVYYRILSTQELERLMADVPSQVLNHAAQNGFTIKNKARGSL